MEKEFENKPDLNDCDISDDIAADVGHSSEAPTALAAVEDSSDSEAFFHEDEADRSTEISFTSDFTVSYVRKRAIKAQKHNLLNSFPKALLFSVLFMLPPLLLFILGMSRMSVNLTAARAIEVIAVLVPVIFGGSLVFGLLGGAMDISRGQHFKTGRLFFAFRDNWFFKAVGSYLLFSLAVCAASFICALPAAIVSAFSANLGDGFAAVATQVIVIILSIAGILLAAQFYLRLALMLPLLIEHSDMRVLEAARLSIKAMKGNTWKLFLLLLSYIGWYILVTAVGAAIIGGCAAAGYAYVMSIFYSGDIYSAYMMLMVGLIVLYIAAYLIFMISCSTIIMRPMIGWAAFYDTITGYEPHEEESEAHEENTENAEPEMLPSPEDAPAEEKDTPIIDEKVE